MGCSRVRGPDHSDPLPSDPYKRLSPYIGSSKLHDLRYRAGHRPGRNVQLSLQALQCVWGSAGRSLRVAHLSVELLVTA